MPVPGWYGSQSHQPTESAIAPAGVPRERIRSAPSLAPPHPPQRRPLYRPPRRPSDHAEALEGGFQPPHGPRQTHPRLQLMPPRARGPPGLQHRCLLQLHWPARRGRPRPGGRRRRGRGGGEAGAGGGGGRGGDVNSELLSSGARLLALAPPHGAPPPGRPPGAPGWLAQYRPYFRPYFLSPARRVTPSDGAGAAASPTCVTPSVRPPAGLPGAPGWLA